ncbi:MAG: N-formylglutamate deformylase, partial [Ramlibacter sp.]|nr:N-formylglutamate deformylase [Ramlibacter sp.]
EDTDWHLARLYRRLTDIGASVLRPHYSRYLIDLNRPPDDTPMYPGAANTELCPTRFFNGDALYVPGHEPSVEERVRRRERYWRPYHEALTAELARLKAKHGWVLLWDAHSIRSQIPWLFEGVLPGLNIGTASGASADVSISDAIAAAAAKHADVSSIVNGRFKGGYITRHYGNPSQHVHAVQLEMCQNLYMSEQPPYGYNEQLAQQIQPVVEDMMNAAVAACEALYG